MYNNVHYMYSKPKGVHSHFLTRWAPISWHWMDQQHQPAAIRKLEQNFNKLSQFNDFSIEKQMRTSENEINFQPEKKIDIWTVAHGIWNIEYERRRHNFWIIWCWPHTTMKISLTFWFRKSEKKKNRRNNIWVLNGV